MDALATGHRIKCLTCVDDFTKECLTITTAFGISGALVTRILNSIALFRGYPATIRTDQVLESTCRGLDRWAFEHGGELHLIQQGKPTQNGFIESFNGRFSDKCLILGQVINDSHEAKLLTLHSFKLCKPKRPNKAAFYKT